MDTLENSVTQSRRWAKVKGTTWSLVCIHTPVVEVDETGEWMLCLLYGACQGREAIRTFSNPPKKTD
jgi:hypothetical protein